MFEQLRQYALKAEHFEKDEVIEWLIPSCIAKETATLLYAEGGMGKSVITTSIAQLAMNESMKCIYLDFDNSKTAIKERNLHRKLIGNNQGIIYIHRSTFEQPAIDMLNTLHQGAVKDGYKNTLIIFDSLKNFLNLGNDNQASDVMKKITDLRDVGATVIIISHTTKSGSNYQGSNNIRDAVDAMFRIEKIESPEGELRAILNSEKERLPVKDIVIAVTTATLSLRTLEIEGARLTQQDKDLISEIKTILAKQPGINKTELMTELGYKKTNRPMRDKLEQFEDIHWRAEKGEKNATLYYLNE